MISKEAFMRDVHRYLDAIRDKDTPNVGFINVPVYMIGYITCMLDFDLITYDDYKELQKKYLG